MKHLFSGPILLIVFFLLLRLIFIAAAKEFYKPRDYEYGEIARNIVKGNGFGHYTETTGEFYQTSSHAPLYPYFLSLFYHFGQTPLTFLIIQIFQAILSVLTIIFVCGVTEIVYNKSTARISQWLFGIYPPMIYYCAKLVPTTILLFLLSLTIFLILKAAERNSPFSILAGICLGFSILCDPIALMLYPAIIIWRIITKKIKTHSLILIFLSSILVITPWTVRNYVIHKNLVPITTQFGINFWIGNNPNATGTDFYKIIDYEKGEYILMPHSLPKSVQDSLNSLSEIERTKFYLKKGFEFIKNNPAQFMKLLIKKFYYYWWFTPSSVYLSKDIIKYQMVLMVCYIPVLILGILGMLWSGAYFKNVILFLLIIFFISSLYIITHVGLIRYRMPIEAILMIFTGFSINRLSGLIFKHNP